MPFVGILWALVAIDEPTILLATLMMPVLLALAAARFGSEFEQANTWGIVLWGWRIAYPISLLLGFFVGISFRIERGSILPEAILVALWAAAAGTITGILSIGGPIWVALVKSIACQWSRRVRRESERNAGL